MSSSVYPRKIDFGKIPTGSTSKSQTVHLANYDLVNDLDISDWGVNSHFVVDKPSPQTLEKSNLVEVAKTPPVSGTSVWIAEGGGYVFEGNPTSGIGVFKIDAAGNAVEVSRYEALKPTTTYGDMHYDGNFLYVCYATGLHIFSIDQYGKLTLKTIYNPYLTGFLRIHGSGGFLYAVNTSRVMSFAVDTFGHPVEKDTFSSAGSTTRIWSKPGWVFVADYGLSTLISLRVDDAGGLTHKYTYAGNSYEALTGDDKYLYTSDAVNGIRSFSVDDEGVIALNDTLTVPSAVVTELHFDGAYLCATNHNILTIISVDRNTGVLTTGVIDISGSSNFRDMVYHDRRLIVAKNTEGLVTYNYGDSRIEFDVRYTPLGYEQHKGELSIQGETIDLYGDSPVTYNPYIMLDSDSIRLIGDTLWSKISFIMFGTFDRVADIKSANPQITSAIKNRHYVPHGTIVKRPVVNDTEESSIGAVEWRR